MSSEFHGRPWSEIYGTSDVENDDSIYAVGEPYVDLCNSIRAYDGTVYIAIDENDSETLWMEFDNAIGYRAREELEIESERPGVELSEYVE